MLLGVLLRYELARDRAPVLSDLLVGHYGSPVGSWGWSLRLPNETSLPH